MTSETPQPRESLLALTSRGAAWGLSSQLIGQLLHLGIRIILARLLAPEDFGLIAMVIVFLSIAGNFSELSLGAALVQYRDLTDDHRNAAFWSVALASTGLAATLALGAPLVGVFYKNGAVIPLTRVLGLSLVLGFPNAVYQAFFLRDMDFKTLGIRRIGSTLVGGIGGITAAVAGLGVWALIIERLLNVSTASIWMVLRSTWRPVWRVSLTAVLELWRFSRHLVAARLVNFFNRNLDNILVGRYLGAGPLGVYSFAYQGVIGPLQYLARPVTAVGFPAFAKIQHQPEVARKAYFSSLSALAVLCAPIVGVGFFYSPWVIPFVLGEKWSAVVVPFQILCVVAVVQTLTSISPGLFNGMGRPQLSLRWNLIAVVFNTSGFVLGLRWGVVGVATGYMVAVLLSAPIHFALVRKVVEIDWATLFSFLAKVGLVFAAAGAGYGVTTALKAGSQQLLLAPGLALVAGLLTSLFVSYLTIPKGWELIRRSASSLRARRIDGQ